MIFLLRRGSLIGARHLHHTSRKPFKEVSIPVPWGKIAGKWWGSTTVKPILCLHGVQDNCGSFEQLVTFLNKNENFSFLAIDFPGHGYSSHFPGGMFYHFFTFPMVVKKISDYFKWHDVSLMGHSLGAVASFTYSVLFPEKVKFFICIDALQPFKSKVSAETLRKNIDMLTKYDDFKMLDDESIAYSMEEAIEKMTKGYDDTIRPERIPLLLERNIAPSKKHPGKYYFSRDPKLKMGVMCDWPQDQIVKDASLLTQPVFICKAKDNKYYGPKQDYHNVLDVLRNTSKDCDFHYLNGNHYLHLNDPEVIGAHIRTFLDKYYTLEDSDLNDLSPIFCDSQPSPLNNISGFQ